MGAAIGCCYRAWAAPGQQPRQSWDLSCAGYLGCAQRGSRQRGSYQPPQLQRGPSPPGHRDMALGSRTVPKAWRDGGTGRPCPQLLHHAQSFPLPLAPVSWGGVSARAPTPSGHAGDNQVPLLPAPIFLHPPKSGGFTHICIPAPTGATGMQGVSLALPLTPGRAGPGCPSSPTIPLLPPYPPPCPPPSPHLLHPPPPPSPFCPWLWVAIAAAPCVADCYLISLEGKLN